MRTIKSEAGEDRATIGHVGSECGGIDALRLGANYNTEQEDSEPPTPKKPTRALPKLIKEEVEAEVKVKVEDQDDPPSYLTQLNSLLYQTADGRLDRVHIWQSDATPFDLGQIFDPTILPTIFRPEASPEFYYNSSPSPAPTWASNGEHGTPKAKNETSSPPMTHPLHQALHQEAIQFPWSPTSSNTKSPIVSTLSRESSLGPSGGPSLFADSQGTQMVAMWYEDTAQAQQNALKARPTKKPCKEERRRCPICNKIFRRPSSLEASTNIDKKENGPD